MGGWIVFQDKDSDLDFIDDWSVRRLAKSRLRQFTTSLDEQSGSFARPKQWERIVIIGNSETPDLFDALFAQRNGRGGP